MRPPPKRLAVQQAIERLAELLDVPSARLEVHAEGSVPEVDALVELGETTFAVEWRSSGALAPIAAAVERLRSVASATDDGPLPLVAVPYMGSVGREYCQEADVAWLDLSGNARIFAPGIRVRVEGRRNRFKSRGRPSSAFAPKSARIARWLLIHPDRPMIQREIAEATGMDEGFTSKIVARLEEDDLLIREPGGAIRPRDPDLLLDAWREDYDFSKHRIVRGHVPARSGEALLRKVTDELEAGGVRFAATGLPAAWLFTGFANFRLVTVYLSEDPEPGLHERLGFREEERGANLWLVVPNDRGVFHGADEHEGVRCVHPVQTYLDLKEHPERADEAAEQLRTEVLDWERNG